MMKSVALTLTILLTPVLAAAGPDATAGKTEMKSALTQVEQNKIVHDHHVNEMEIEMGKVAKTNSKSTDAKKYAAMMEKMAKLKTLEGAEFDTMYLQMMVEGHDKEVALNPSVAATVADPDVKAWVEKRGESLKKHADEAPPLQSKKPTAADAKTSKN